MTTVRAKRVKIGSPAKFAGVFLTCILLGSCSSNQNAFFEQSDVLISQGYTWQKLDRCRPPKEDALSIPIIRSDGRKLVCYQLAPPRMLSPHYQLQQNQQHQHPQQTQIPILGILISSGTFQISNRAGMVRLRR